MARKNKGETTDTDLLTDEEKEVLEAAEAAKLAKQEARAEAKIKVKAFLDECENPELVEAIKNLISFGKARSAGATRVSATDLIRVDLVENGFVSELEIFQKYRIGRPEMSIKRRLLVQKYDEVDRVYFNFNPDKEGYEVESVGSVPEGWDGYVVSEEADL